MKNILKYDTHDLFATNESKLDKPYVVYDHEHVHYGTEYVDLGLPSGTKWATCNLGASTPEEYGDFYAWGETTPNKENYSWSTYKYGTSETSLTKYNTESNRGPVDDKTVLDLEDDAAHAVMGGNWHMPTKDQISELLNSNNTTSEWTTLNGVSGRLFTSKKNGKTLFFPASGDQLGSSVNNRGYIFHVWSSSLDESYSYNAHSLDSYSADVYLYYFDRYCGFSVRGCMD